MLFYLLYLILGILCVFIIVPVIHIFKAIKRNHKIETIGCVLWNLNDNDFNDNFLKAVLIRIFGFIIWPIRIIQFFRYEEYYMNAYTQYEEKEES